MTDYKPGQRVHVKALDMEINLDQNGTYVKPANYNDGFFKHVVLIDDYRELCFQDAEVTPIAEPTILIENAKWADVINAIGNQPNHGKGRRYTITFEEQAK